MKVAIPQEARDRARELYVAEGLSFNQAAQASGVTRRTLQRWSKREGWQEMKQQISLELAEIERNTIRLRKLLLEKALESLSADDAEIEPKVINAVARLESAAARRGKEGGLDGPFENEIVREIRTPQEAVLALEEAVEQEINRLLTRPGTLTLTAIKDLKKALELIDEMKARYAAGPDDQAKGLSEEKAAEIRRKIMGLKG